MNKILFKEGDLVYNLRKGGEIHIVVNSDFSNIQKSADVIYEAGYTLMNSIKFNEVDWTLVVKKVKPEPRPVVEESAKDE